MFVIDERDAESKGSINKKGHFQADLMGLVVEVKDSTRNPDKWAYYGFEANSKIAEAMPKGNDCWSCHDQHGAVEHTLAQFYPTLKPVAKNFGTYNEARERSNRSWIRITFKTRRPTPRKCPSVISQ